MGVIAEGQYRMVRVEWIDAHGCSPEWTEMPDKDTVRIPTVDSMGWLVYEDERAIVVMPHWCPKSPGVTEQGCGDMTIPRSSIVKIVELQEVGAPAAEPEAAPFRPVLAADDVVASDKPRPVLAVAAGMPVLTANDDAVESPPPEPTSFAEARAERLADSREWSPLDALRATIREVLAKELECVSMTILGVREVGENERVLFMRHSGPESTKAEVTHMLAMAMQQHLGG